MGKIISGENFIKYQRHAEYIFVYRMYINNAEPIENVKEKLTLTIWKGKAAYQQEGL